MSQVAGSGPPMAELRAGMTRIRENILQKKLQGYRHAGSDGPIARGTSYDFHTDLKNLLDAFEPLALEYERLVDEHRKVVSSPSPQVDVLNRLVSDLKAQLNVAQTLAESRAKDVAAYQGELTRNNSRHDADTETVHSQISQIAKLEEDVRARSSALDRANLSIKSLQEDISHLNSRLDEATQVRVEITEAREESWLFSILRSYYARSDYHEYRSAAQQEGDEVRFEITFRKNVEEAMPF